MLEVTLSHSGTVRHIFTSSRTKIYSSNHCYCGTLSSFFFITICNNVLWLIEVESKDVSRFIFLLSFPIRRGLFLAIRSHLQSPLLSEKPILRMKSIFAWPKGESSSFSFNFNHQQSGRWQAPCSLNNCPLLTLGIRAMRKGQQAQDVFTLSGVTLSSVENELIYRLQ